MQRTDKTTSLVVFAFDKLTEYSRELDIPAEALVGAFVAEATYIAEGLIKQGTMNRRLYQLSYDTAYLTVSGHSDLALDLLQTSVQEEAELKPENRKDLIQNLDRLRELIKKDD